MANHAPAPPNTTDGEVSRSTRFKTSLSLSAQGLLLLTRQLQEPGDYLDDASSVLRGISISSPLRLFTKKGAVVNGP